METTGELETIRLHDFAKKVNAIQVFPIKRESQRLVSIEAVQTLDSVAGERQPSLQIDGFYCKYVNHGRSVSKVPGCLLTHSQIAYQYPPF